MSKIQVTPLRPGITGSHIPYARYHQLHFRDNVTGDLVWFVSNSAGDTVYLWTQQGEGAAAQRASSQDISDLSSSAQDSTGVVHAVGNYGGGNCYTRITLTRSGGHVTGWSLTTPFYLPAMTSPLNTGTPDSWLGCVSVLRNGSNAERVFIGMIDGNSAAQYCAAVCHGPLDADADTDFVSLTGAPGWTKFPTQTSTNTAVAAPYCFNIAIEQYGSSGHIFVVAGASSRGDVANYGCSLVGYRATASGANWTVDTANPCAMAGTFYETLLGASCRDSAGNAYVSWATRADQGTATIGLSRIAANGTFTAEHLTTTFTHGGEVRTYPFVASDGTTGIICDPGVYDYEVTPHRELKLYENSVWRSYWVDSARAPENSYTSRGSRGSLGEVIWSAGDTYYPSQMALGAVSARSGSETGVLFDNYSLPAYGTTSLAVDYATAVPHATRDQHVCVVGLKGTATTGGSVTLPAGWTTRAELYGAGGYASQGVDTGNTGCCIATKDSVNGSETGTITATLGSSNTAWGLMVRLTKAGDGDWDFAGATGSDITGGATLSVTYSTAVNLAPGDLIVVGVAIPTDVATPRQFTAPTLSASGITFSECYLVTESDSTTGNDIGGVTCYARVLSGTGTVSVTFAATASGTTTNVRGASVLLRAREATASGVTSTVTATAGAPSASATLSVTRPIAAVTASAGAPTSAASMSAGQPVSAAVGATAGGPTASASLSVGQAASCVVTASAGAPSASAVGSVGAPVTASVSAGAGAPTSAAAVSVGEAITCAAAANAGAPTASASAQVGSIVSCTVSCAAGAPTASATLSVGESVACTVQASAGAPASSASLQVGTDALSQLIADILALVPDLEFLYAAEHAVLTDGFVTSLPGVVGATLVPISTPVVTRVGKVLRNANTVTASTLTGPTVASIRYTLGVFAPSSVPNDYWVALKFNNAILTDEFAVTSNPGTLSLYNQGYNHTVNGVVTENITTRLSVIESLKAIATPKAVTSIDLFGQGSSTIGRNWRGDIGLVLGGPTIPTAEVRAELVSKVSAYYLAVSGTVAATAGGPTAAASVSVGEAVSAAVSATAGAPTANAALQTGQAVTATVSAAAGAPTASVAAQVGVSVSCSVTASAGAPTASATGAVGEPLSASVSASAGAPSASATFSIEQRFTLEASAGAPAASAAVSVGEPVAATVTATAGAPSSSGVILVGSVINAAVSATAGAPSAAAQFSVQLPQVAVAASAGAPVASASVSIGEAINVLVQAAAGGPTANASIVITNQAAPVVGRVVVRERAMPRVIVRSI